MVQMYFESENLIRFRKNITLLLQCSMHPKILPKFYSKQKLIKTKLNELDM